MQTGSFFNADDTLSSSGGGAAYASVIARTLEFLIFIVIYLRTKPEFAVKVRDFLKIDPGMFMTILKKGYLLLFGELHHSKSLLYSIWRDLFINGYHNRKDTGRRKLKESADAEDLAFVGWSGVRMHNGLIRTVNDASRAGDLRSSQ